MTITRYISPALAVQWHDDIKPSFFQMRKDLGNVQTITLHRDNPNDGSDVAVGPFEVVIVTASSATPHVGDDGSIAFVGVTGEFQSDDPGFSDIARDDRFCFSNGTCGKVTAGPIEDVAFTRAPFVVER